MAAALGILLPPLGLTLVGMLLVGVLVVLRVPALARALGPAPAARSGPAPEAHGTRSSPDEARTIALDEVTPPAGKGPLPSTAEAGGPGRLDAATSANGDRRIVPFGPPRRERTPRPAGGSVIP